MGNIPTYDVRKPVKYSTGIWPTPDMKKVYNPSRDIMKMTEAVSNALFTYAKTRNEAETKDALIAYDTDTINLTYEELNKRGYDAVGGAERIRTTLVSLKDEHLQNVPSHLREKLSQEFDAKNNHRLAQVMAHEGQQTAVWNEENNKLLIETYSKSAQLSPENVGVYVDWAESALGDDFTEEARSDIISSAIDGYIQTDPKEAKKLFDKTKKFLTSDHTRIYDERVKRAVEGQKQDEENAEKLRQKAIKEAQEKLFRDSQNNLNQLYVEESLNADAIMKAYFPPDKESMRTEWIRRYHAQVSGDRVAKEKEFRAKQAAYDRLDRELDQAKKEAERASEKDRKAKEKEVKRLEKEKAAAEKEARQAAKEAKLSEKYNAEISVRERINKDPHGITEDDIYALKEFEVSGSTIDALVKKLQKKQEVDEVSDYSKQTYKSLERLRQHKFFVNADIEDLDEQSIDEEKEYLKAIRATDEFYATTPNPTRKQVEDFEDMLTKEIMERRAEQQVGFFGWLLGMSQKGWDMVYGTGKTETATSSTPERIIIRTGTKNGRKVVQYSDGAIEYAN